MLVRATILLLVMLNLGTALWWMTRTAPVDVQVEAEVPPGVLRLELAQAQVSATATAVAEHPAPIVPAAPVASDVAGSTQRRCFAFGPFADVAAAQAARAALPAGVLDARLRAVVASGGAWRVVLPALADRPAANAMAERIRQAGFNDLFVMGEGTDANSIALGRFSSEAGARKHASALRAAGFEVRVDPLGATRQWLEVAAGEAFDGQAAKQASASPGVRDLDCADIGKV